MSTEATSSPSGFKPRTELFRGFVIKEASRLVGVEPPLRVGWQFHARIIQVLSASNPSLIQNGREVCVNYYDAGHPGVYRGALVEVRGAIELSDPKCPTIEVHPRSGDYLIVDEEMGYGTGARLAVERSSLPIPLGLRSRTRTAS